jgi:hypothetical protein
MSQQIKISIDQDAYEALVTETKKRGTTQGKLISAAIRQLLLPEQQAEEDEQIMLVGLLQAHAKLDCLLKAMDISERDVEARLYPDAQPVTPQTFYKDWQTDEQATTAPLVPQSRTPQPETSLFGKIVRLFVK